MLNSVLCHVTDMAKLPAFVYLVLLESHCTHFKNIYELQGSFIYFLLPE